MAPRRRLTQEEGLELPEGIIQHIQSFLGDEEAAQTSLVSKSWYNSWCIRPNIYLDGYDFNEIGFWDYATKTVQRCIDLNVKVEKLVLLMTFTYDTSLVDKLVVDILKLRVKQLMLYFNASDDDTYVLPSQVFANKNMTGLYLGRCKVDDLISRNILCSNLRTLSLKNVSIEDSTFKDILVGCPIIESLTLDWTDLMRINACDLYNLKTLIVKGLVVLEPPGITSSVICGQFLNLSCMVLKDLNIDDSFLTNLSSSFPKLEDLTLKRLNYYTDVQISSLTISSNSIKRLSLKHSHLFGMWNIANFDVPNIREFKFSGDHAPVAISFTPVSGEWKSQINLIKNDEILDLSKLRELRRKIGWSKISLCLSVYHDRDGFPERSLDDYLLPAVDELAYYVMPSCATYKFFIECVLSCRPKFVNFVHDSVALAIPFLYKKLTEQKKNGIYTTDYSLSIYLMNDLLEVSVEFREDSLMQWKPLNSSSDAVEIRNHRAKHLRLKLVWESLTPAPELTIINFVDPCIDED